MVEAAEVVEAVLVWVLEVAEVLVGVREAVVDRALIGGVELSSMS